MTKNKAVINARIDKIMFENLLIEDEIGPGSNCKYENLKTYLIDQAKETKMNSI